ncbi:hypothetical protein CO726_24845 [Bacillus fungorum]|uniref:Uncharacterized protein n=1 Tax=Bacillus fungorum TaxID=2039284 RepID=A0A2G6Q7K0_9BACI|nr:hypothetical protein [Bacillus fungorum]PIE92797.1 hypothetical protein CO726_24845 [Bacillus fungorum]
MNLKLQMKMNLNKKISNNEMIKLAKKLGGISEAGDYVNITDKEIDFKISKKQDLLSLLFQNGVGSVIAFLEKYVFYYDPVQIGEVFSQDSGRIALIYAFKNYIYVVKLIDGYNEIEISDTKGESKNILCEDGRKVEIENHIVMAHVLFGKK